MLPVFVCGEKGERGGRRKGRGFVWEDNRAVFWRQLSFIQSRYDFERIIRQLLRQKKVADMQGAEGQEETRQTNLDGELREVNVRPSREDGRRGKPR